MRASSSNSLEGNFLVKVFFFVERVTISRPPEVTRASRIRLSSQTLDSAVRGVGACGVGHVVVTSS